MKLLKGATYLSGLLVGAAVGAVLPTLVIVIYKLWRGIEGMGWGDVKYPGIRMPSERSGGRAHEGRS